MIYNKSNKHPPLHALFSLVALALSGRTLMLLTSFQQTGFILLILSYLILSIAVVSQLARLLNAPKRSRIVLALRTLDLELTSSFRCFFTRFLTSLPQMNATDRPAILFLHGMLGNGQNGRFLLKKLSRFGSVYTIDMGTDNETAYQVSYGKEIERCALLVAEKIEQIFRETGQQQVILIGHSRGGVVANYLATTRLEKRIPLVITLSSPLQYPNCDDQVAEFINGLNESLAGNSSTLFLHLWAEGDIVVPKESSFPRESPQIKRIKIPHSGHLSILHSEEAVEKISEVLSVGKFGEVNDLSALR